MGNLEKKMMGDSVLHLWFPAPSGIVVCVWLGVCVCMRVCAGACVCDAQIIQMLHKLRGSTPKSYY